MDFKKWGQMLFSYTNDKNQIVYHVRKFNSELLTLDNDSTFKKVELNQEKWFRNMEEGSITIKDQIYSLVPTQNKREFVVENNLLIGTRPINITNFKI